MKKGLKNRGHNTYLLFIKFQLDIRMARFARLVIPGLPHHVVQRGVRSMDIFANDYDRTLYLQLLSEEAERFGLVFNSWCLMTNHVHLVVVPENENSLARAIGESHRRYTVLKNKAEGVLGYLFQGRFSSCVLDQSHFVAASRYVELNPVKAGMVENPEDYVWSSCRYHLGLTDSDFLIKEPVITTIVDDWAEFLRDGNNELEDRVCAGTRTGRPVGDVDFILNLEVLTDRRLIPRKPGRPRKTNK